jgi:hypothetical protein
MRPAGTPKVLGAAMRQMNLSARAYHRVLKLARTIADLAGSERIQPAHIAEAIHLRPVETDGVGLGRAFTHVTWKDDMQQARQGWYLHNAA